MPPRAAPAVKAKAALQKKKSQAKKSRSPPARSTRRTATTKGAKEPSSSNTNASNRSRGSYKTSSLTLDELGKAGAQTTGLRLEPSTMESYNTYIRRWVKFCATHDIESKKVDKDTPENIRCMLVDMSLTLGVSPPSLIPLARQLRFGPERNGLVLRLAC